MGLLGYYERLRWKDGPGDSVVSLALRAPAGRSGVCLVPTDCQAVWIMLTPTRTSVTDDCSGQIVLSDVAGEKLPQAAAQLVCTNRFGVAVNLDLAPTELLPSGQVLPRLFSRQLRERFETLQGWERSCRQEGTER
jgi:hypothetical protein